MDDTTPRTGTDGPWGIEDSLALGRAAFKGTVFVGTITLPSGRRLTADEANALLERERERRSS